MLENEPCYIVTDALETAMTTFPGMAEKFFSSVEKKSLIERIEQLHINTLRLYFEPFFLGGGDNLVLC